MESSRNERITALFQREADHLERAVARRVKAPAAITEDACAFAWATLVASETVDVEHPSVFAWLIVVATRESWRLARRQTASLGEVQLDVTDQVSIEDIAEADDAKALVDQLPERQRTVITLAALGLSHDEMADVLGWTVRTVQRQLYRARARLRESRG